MGVPVRRGLRHLRNYGVLLTAVAATKWVKRRFEGTYYQRKVAETAESVGSGLTVNGESEVNESTHLGDNVNFNGLTIRGAGRVTIGDNFHSGPDILILTQNHNYDDGDAIPYDDTYIRHEVTIGDNGWLGARVTVVPGVEIGEGAIVQAGATVTDDIPKGAIAGGSPAEVFQTRDMDHYERLKSEGKFH